MKKSDNDLECRIWACQEEGISNVTSSKKNEKEEDMAVFRGGAAATNVPMEGLLSARGHSYRERDNDTTRDTSTVGRGQVQKARVVVSS